MTATVIKRNPFTDYGDLPMPDYEGGERLKIPLLHPPARRREERLVKRPSRVEEGGRKRAGLTFATRARQFSIPSPGDPGSISKKQIFSRYGDRESDSGSDET